MNERIGILEDCGGSVVICDHCEDVFSKLSGRYHDGDECPMCRDGQAAPDCTRAVTQQAMAVLMFANKAIAAVGRVFADAARPTEEDGQ